MSDSEDSTVTYTEAPPSPDYVLGPEEPKHAPPSPIYVPYVPEPAYPEFMPPEDEVFPAKEQPLPAAVSPTADSLGYVPESDPEEDPEEDDDEDPEEDPTDYPTDEGDDGDDEDESSDDDEDDDVDIEGGWRRRLLAIPTPPPSPLSPWSSPLTQIPSPPLPVSPPLPLAPPPLPISPTYPLGYRAAMIRLRVEAPSTSYSPLLYIILFYTKEDTPPTPNIPDVVTTYEEVIIALSVLEVMSLRTTVLSQQAVITELQAMDRRRQAAITELLTVDRRRQAQFTEALKLLKGLQAQMTEFQRQQGPAKGPAQPDAPEEAGSSS
ncbi:hypothetical protein Tco_0295385 [Tanacetum coccineum]